MVSFSATATVNLVNGVIKYEVTISRSDRFFTFECNVVANGLKSKMDVALGWSSISTPSSGYVASVLSTSDHQLAIIDIRIKAKASDCSPSGVKIYFDTGKCRWY
jgi:hypothetical protein